MKEMKITISAVRLSGILSAINEGLYVGFIAQLSVATRHTTATVRYMIEPEKISAVLPDIMRHAKSVEIS